MVALCGRSDDDALGVSSISFLIFRCAETGLSEDSSHALNSFPGRLLVVDQIQIDFSRWEASVRRNSIIRLL